MYIKIKMSDDTEYSGHLQFNRYGMNNRKKLELYSDVEGVIATFTVNLPYESLKDNEVFIDSENYYKQLLYLGIISESSEIKHMGSNNNKIYKCKLLING